MYGYTVHVKRFLMEATATVFVAVGGLAQTPAFWSLQTAASGAGTERSR
jgi:hypothetical protein